MCDNMNKIAFRYFCYISTSTTQYLHVLGLSLKMEDRNNLNIQYHPIPINLTNAYRLITHNVHPYICMCTAVIKLAKLCKTSCFKT